MQTQSRVSYIWEEGMATLPYSTGVSLHSHTSASKESLFLLHKMGTEAPFAGALLRCYERASQKRSELTLDFVAANWRPPLLPRMAFDTEGRQIQRLGLEALVSLTDHDTMEAPLLLRTISVARQIPVSVEWTAPFGRTTFHIGVHNLPSADAIDWMRRFEQFTEDPSDADLGALLEELDAIPQVLTILNHPVWDLHKIGNRPHGDELDRFLSENGAYVHALELNGLRHARENLEVARVAGRSRHVLISGGDRHGMEANANINLTNATSFTEFVREIRVERRSHVLFLEQYARAWEQRILDSTVDAVSDFPQFSPGWQRWDERAFHPDADGVMRPLSELWVDGRPPIALRLAIQAVRLLRSRSLAGALSLAFPGVNRIPGMRCDVPSTISGRRSSIGRFRLGTPILASSQRVGGGVGPGEDGWASR